MSGRGSVEWVWVVKLVTSGQTCIRYLGASTLPRHLRDVRETPVKKADGLLAIGSL